VVVSVSLPFPVCCCSQHFTGLVSKVLDVGGYMGCEEEIHGMSLLYTLRGVTTKLGDLFSKN
jgi:hypothetical protein